MEPCATPNTNAKVEYVMTFIAEVYVYLTMITLQIGKLLNIIGYQMINNNKFKNKLKKNKYQKSNKSLNKNNKKLIIHL